MAARFWVGGTGTWDNSSTTHWAATSGGTGGASVPGALDTVTFDASSGGGIVTPNYDISVVSITMGAFSGTLDFSANNNNITISIFNASGSGVRTLKMGGGIWSITGNNTTVWDTTNFFNLTVNAGTSTLQFTYSGSTGTRTIATSTSSMTFNNVIISAGSDIFSQTGILNIIGNFSTLGFTGTYSKTTNDLNIGGSFTLGTGSTWSSTGGTVTLTSSDTVNINTNGVNFNQSLTINGTGSFTLQNNLDCSGSIVATLTVTQGTFNANNFNITVALFNSSNANARTINMGSGTWAITGNSATVWTISTATNLTLNAGTSTLQFTYSGSAGTRTISTGSSTVAYNNVTISAGSDTVSQSGVFTINGDFSTSGFTGTYSKTTSTLTIGGSFILGGGATWSSTGGIVTLTSSGSVNINTNGVNLNQSLTINGTGSFTLQNNLNCAGSVTAVLTITQGTFNANNFNITVATFNSSNTNVRTINMGSGTWTITGNSTTVWNISTATNLTFNGGTSTVQFTYSGSTGTRTLSAGVVTYNNWIISAGSDTISQSATFVCTGNFSTSGFLGIFSKGSASLTIGGNFILGLGSTWASTAGSIILTSSSSVNINTNGVKLNQSLTINGTGSFTLQNNLACSGSIISTLTVAQGTFNANNFNIAVAIFNSSNTNVRTINMGSGTWTITGSGTTVWTINIGTNLTFNCNTSSLQFTYSGSTGTRTIGTGSTFVYYNFYITGGADTISIASLFCNNFNTSGFTGTYSKTTSSITASGDFVIGAGSTWSSTSGTITLTSAGTANINTNGITINQSITCNGTGTFILQNSLDISGSVVGILTLTQGTLTANNYNLTCARFGSSNTNPRTLNMGNGTWSITGNNAAVWNMGTITNLTFNANSSTVNFTYSGSVGTRTFTSGSLTYNNYSVSAGSDIFSSTGTLMLNGNFSTVGFTGTYNKTTGSITCRGNFSLGANSLFSSTAGGITMASTGSVNIATNGVNMNISLTINGVGGTFTLQNDLDLSGSVNTTFIITAGTFIANNFNIRAVLFSSSNSNTRTINMGSGTWTLTGTGSAWNLSTITNLTLVSATAPILFTGSAVTFTGGSTTYGNVTFTGGGVCNVAGVNTFAILTYTGIGPTDVLMIAQTVITGTLTVTGYSPANKTAVKTGTAGALKSITFGTASLSNVTWTDISLSQNGSGAWDLTEDLILNSATNIPVLTITQGTFSTNSFNVSTGNFNSTGTATRAINMGSATCTLTGASGGVSLSATGLTFNAGTSSFIFTNAGSGTVTITAGGGTILFNTIWFNRGASTGANVVAGNLNCNNFIDTGTATHTIIVNGSNALTVTTTWDVTGSAGNLTTLTSSTPTTASFQLINMSGAPFSSDYLNIQHSVATPGNYWLAGLNSVNNQDVLSPGYGWAFSNQAVIQASFFSCM
ncbi:hypothetical protein [Mucilaginibacter sp.]|uniref:beta strand repeat-containing protein n=1 Tax=Mucilaginibacter sp. TaxID=1882438 RepID=UPI0026228278|nr:hypothetical protein [Mucilaginibacter sp.]MDB4922074.1 hypothetical protein [Mucilaginibacter sp.]